MSGKEDGGDETLSGEDDDEGNGDARSGEASDEEQDHSPETAHGPESDPTDTDRIEEIEEELREKENEIADLRHKLEPKLQEAEDEIAELRAELEGEIADHERRLDELHDELTETSRRERAEQTAEPSRGSHFPSPPSNRPPKAAGVILGATGLLGLLVSLLAGVLELSFGSVSPFTTSLGSRALIATAAVSAALSIAIFMGGWWSYKRKQWYYAVFTALVCSVSLTPVGLPALLLLAVSERGFE